MLRSSVGADARGEFIPRNYAPPLPEGKPEGDNSWMPEFLPTLLFWSAALAIVLGQVMILRSTARAWRLAGARVPVMERVWAWLPALALAAVLYFSWRMATRPPIVEIQLTPGAQGISL